MEGGKETIETPAVTQMRGEWDADRGSRDHFTRLTGLGTGLAVGCVVVPQRQERW